MIKKIFIVFILVTNLTFTNSIFGQESGTFRSAVANGAWTTPASWEYYNGISWIIPDKYPGQLLSVTEAVIIQYGHTITMGPTPLSTLSPFWDLTINGKLIMEGNNEFVEFKLATKKIVVTENLIPAATIEFVKKTQLKLPENATITVGNDGFTGSCTNNNEIWIGGVIYSICTGGNQEINFDEIIALGGTGNADANSPVCIGNPINLYATPPPNGDTYTFAWTGPNGFTSIAQNPIISNAQDLVNEGEYTVLMTYLSNTITAKTTVEVSNSTLPAPPIIGAITSDCSILTGSIELTGLPSSGLWKLVTNPGGDEVYGEGTTKVISGLSIGTYTFEVTNVTSGENGIVNVSCTSLPSANASISSVNNSWKTNAGNTDWNNAANWDCGVVPSVNSQVSINPGTFQPEISSNVDIVTLLIPVGATLKIKSGANLKITGGIGNEGTITIENNANLVQTGANNNNSGSGNVIVKRESNALNRLDYTMWSSPVTGSQSLLDFSPLTNSTRFYTYNSSTNFYNSVIPESTTFAKGIGYLIRMPNTDPTLNYDAGTGTLNYKGEFIGKLNNAFVTLSGLTPNSFYAVGNPYPSTIYADAFNIENGTTGTFYFWRKKNNSLNSSYATYTNFAGVANSGDPNAIVPNGIIQVGQGFIVELKTGTTQLFFKNYMRTQNNNNQILKTKGIEKHRIWLNLSNGSIPVNQMVVGYMSGATMNVDQEIDGAYINDSQTALNSLINNEEYVIQARSLPFDGTDVIPLAFKTAADGNFTIAIDHSDGLFSGSQAIILKDNISGVETDLKTGAYTFTAKSGVDNTRFSLKYQKTLGVNSQVFDDSSVLVYKSKNAIHIKSSSTISYVKVYDILGRLVFEKIKVNANEASIESSKLAKQVLLVEITSQDNKVVNKKIVN